MNDLITTLKTLIDSNKPLPFGWPNCYYLYADDYIRLKHKLPLRQRSNSQHYLDDDHHAEKRTLPYRFNPLRLTLQGYRSK